jgi:exopolysaccharide biosynthesis polyprenyl glycosylphosphotransferase
MMSRIFYYTLLPRGIAYLLPAFAFMISPRTHLRSLWLPFVRGTFPEYYLSLLLFTELVWIVVAEYYKLSTILRLSWEYTGIKAAFFACFAAFFLQSTLFLFARNPPLSPMLVVLINTFLLGLVMACTRRLRRGPLAAHWQKRSKRIIVVGTDRYARRCVRLFRRSPALQYDIEAYLQLPGQPVMVEGAPVINSSTSGRLEKLTFDQIVVALPPASYSQVASIVDNVYDLGKPVRAVFDLGPRLSLRDKLFQTDRLQIVTLSASRIDSFAYVVLKRIFDIVASIIGLVILSPLLVVIAFFVKVSSPGPVLFVQERIGRHGRLFKMIKFRTMYCSDKSDSDTIWTTNDDPRVTRIGSILRRFSLDELPQLLNVIYGEMSLVGPRPERPYFVDRFEKSIARYGLRHACKVGITGWAQVNGLRGDTSIPDRLRYDLEYIQNWSLARDLQIIARTASVALGAGRSEP